VRSQLHRQHLRHDQRDVLEYCCAARHESKSDADLWPSSVEPPDDATWERSVRAFLDDLAEVRRIAADPSIDLFAAVPRGTTQTWLRMLQIIAEHNAYHLGQFVMLRRMLGAWP
jgi:hypothetical protein